MGVKYIIRYHETKWRTEVDVPSYTDAPIEVKGVHSSAGEVYHENDEHILSSKFNFSFYTDGDLYDLQTCNDLEVSVKVYEDNNIFWSGFLIADGIKQYDRGIKSAVDLIATDGLNATEDLDFEYPEEELPIQMPTYESVLKTPLHLILYVLRKINNELPIRWSVSTVNALDETKDAFCGITPLGRKELLMYDGVDCKFILENVLKSFNLKMSQNNGVWYIYNQLDVMDSFVGYEYVFGSVVAYSEDNKFLPIIRLTNDAYFEVQKGVGSVNVKYNPIKDVNVIPNGDFNDYYNDGTHDRPLYWVSSNAPMYSTILPDYRISMRPIDDFGRPERSNNFDGAFSNVPSTMNFEKSIPIESHNLYKKFNLSFRIMPYLYPTYPIGHEKEGMIDWVGSKPFAMRIKFTLMNIDTNVLEEWFLNENGFWVRDTVSNFKVVSYSTDEINNVMTIKLSGYGVTDQTFTIREFIEDVPNYIEDTNVTFSSNFEDLDETLDYIVSQDTRFTRQGADELLFDIQSRRTRNPIALIVNSSGVTTSNWINFIVDNTINEDVIEYQFQSKANQGSIVLPDMGEVIPDGRGHLSMSFRQIAEVKTIIDNIEMRLDSVTENYEMKLTGNTNTKGEDFELRISSSFNGFDLTSYMTDYSESDLYFLFIRNGVSATLTEHYGRDYLRLNARPRRLYTANFKGRSSMHDVFEYKGAKFVPLTLSYNTELNESNGQWIELVDNNIENLEIKITDGNNDNNRS